MMIQPGQEPDMGRIIWEKCGLYHVAKKGTPLPTAALSQAALVRARFVLALDRKTEMNIPAQGSQIWQLTPVVCCLTQVTK